MADSSLPEDGQLDAATRILLLDDDLELADTLKALMETRDYLVSTASNGTNGLRKVKEADFDVIICDMVMPGMAGDAFYREVQQLKPELCERFIFMTGHRDDPMVSRFLDETDALVLFKPVPTAELVHQISLVLKKTASRKVDA